MEIKKYELPLAHIKPGETVLLTSRKVSPGKILYPIGFEIDARAARDLSVHDVRVGPNSQFCSSCPIPATLFSNGPALIPIRLDPLRSGMKLSIRLENLGAEVVKFEALVVCAVEKPKIQHPVVLGYDFQVDSISGQLVQSQLTLEPCRLHVPPHLLDMFEVVHVKAEEYLDVEGAPEIPAEQLTSSSLMCSGKISFSNASTILEGCGIYVCVKNRTATPQRFRAALLGHPRSYESDSGLLSGVE